MKDKSFHILFGICVLMFAADLISTLQLGELVQYLEANPLFSFGGLPLIIFLNLAFMGGYYWMYNRGKVNTRFIIIFSLVIITITRLIAVSQNIAIGNNPPTLTQAMAVTQAMKTEASTRLVTLNILPFFNGIIAWYFFKYDHEISRKGEKNA